MYGMSLNFSVYTEELLATDKIMYLLVLMVSTTHI